MSASFFLDTNVLAYAFDPAAPAKRERARELVNEALSSGSGCISLQVAQEFLNICLRKFAVPMTVPEAAAYLEETLTPLCRVFPSIDLLKSALELKERCRYSFYDSLIIAAALEAGCELLYSEDLHHGQQIGRLRIVNPFVT